MCHNAEGLDSPLQIYSSLWQFKATLRRHFDSGLMRWTVMKVTEVTYYLSYFCYYFWQGSHFVEGKIDSECFIFSWLYFLTAFSHHPDWEHYQSHRPLWTLWGIINRATLTEKRSLKTFQGQRTCAPFSSWHYYTDVRLSSFLYLSDVSYCPEYKVVSSVSQIWPKCWQ